jgi:hypothetical protein
LVHNYLDWLLTEKNAPLGSSRETRIDNLSGTLKFNRDEIISLFASLIAYSVRYAIKEKKGLVIGRDHFIVGQAEQIQERIVNVYVKSQRKLPENSKKTDEEIAGDLLNEAQEYVNLILGSTST